MSTFECWGKGPEFTKQHLESITVQTYRPLQCVISDHSKDDEIEKIVKSIDPKGVDVIYVRYDEHYGSPGHNWNNCLKYATGEYLQYVSMDSWHHDPTSISKIVSFFEENKVIEWIAIPCVVYPEMKIFYPWWNKEYELNENTIGGPDSIIFRASIKHITFNTEFMYYGDNVWYYEMHLAAKHPPHLYKGDPVYTVRVHDLQQQKVVKSERREKDLQDVLDTYGTFKPSINYTTPYIKPTRDLIDIVKEAGVPFKDGKIIIPDWVTSIKLDIGVCYTATHTQNWMDADPGAMVFGFEPNPLSYKSITSRPEDRPKDFNGYMFGRTGQFHQIEYDLVGKRCFFFPVALSDTNEMMDFYCTSIMPDCSSLLKPKSDFTGVDQVVKVPVFTLDEFFRLLPDDKIIDFIKIDVQGADLKVLKGARKYLAERVVFTTVEPETKQYENCLDNNEENITNYMHSIGFQRVRHSNTNDPTFLNRRFWDRQNVYISQFL
jgi:FkbM family methyltransferase